MTYRIAILGGGPSALFIYKKFVDCSVRNFEIDIFEATGRLGCGMPYSWRGATKEHITNISGDEIPSLPQSLVEWIEEQTDVTLQNFGINRSKFNKRTTISRLLFGEYLTKQFEKLILLGQQLGIKTRVHLNCRVVDVIAENAKDEMTLVLEDGRFSPHNIVIMCTGHVWPASHEGKVVGYFDSPYPPSKLSGRFNHNIAIRGSSLTAVDAVRTLARHHGEFKSAPSGKLSYKAHEDFQNFKITLHSTHGLLPAVRFHLEDPWLEEKLLLSAEEIAHIRQDHAGFIPLDLIFQRKFKDTFREKDSEFFSHIRDMNLEDFVTNIMKHRQSKNPFTLLKSEYDEAQHSIKAKHSIYWKESIGALSFIINYPAKHFSAEDFLRLRNILQPLISVIIAYIPQRSCEELIALQEAGRLDLLAVGVQSNVECGDAGVAYHYVDGMGQSVRLNYQTFIDCVGQRHLTIEEFPFKSLVHDKIVGRAFVNFKSNDHGKRLADAGTKDVIEVDGSFRLYVSGISINDSFQAVNDSQEANDHLYVMAVPYISGHNPDYSGLDFCSEAAQRIVNKIMED